MSQKAFTALCVDVKWHCKVYNSVCQTALMLLIDTGVLLREKKEKEKKKRHTNIFLQRKHSSETIFLFYGCLCTVEPTLLQHHWKRWVCIRTINWNHIGTQDRCLNLMLIPPPEISSESGISHSDTMAIIFYKWPLTLNAFKLGENPLSEKTGLYVVSCWTTCKKY